MRNYLRKFLGLGLLGLLLAAPAMMAQRQVGGKKTAGGTHKKSGKAKAPTKSGRAS